LDRMEHEPIAPMLVISGLARYQRLCRPHARQITTGVGQILSLTNGGEQLMTAMGTRGRLRILLGSGPGVSTTCAMFGEAHRRAERGTDVVVAYAPAQGRPPAALLAGLELMPPANVPFRGTIVKELDLSAVLARKPEVALLEGFAHANPPGSRHATRWQDAEELLQGGIDVVSTVDVRELDSLRDVVEKITGRPPAQTVPDTFVRAADEVEIVDAAPETLRDRMAHGDTYPAEQAEGALADWFDMGTLSALRELALLWLAATLTDDRRRHRAGRPLSCVPHDRERMVVALAGGRDGERLIRRAARLAARSGADLLAVHVARPAGPAGRGLGAPATQAQLVRSLGGSYHELSDDNIPAALLTFARAENATQLVLGATRRSWRTALSPRTTIASRVLRGATGIDVHIATCAPTATTIR
jgi:two-component system sensor histidine kinase KdpD